jgi:hypothetical protein
MVESYPEGAQQISPGRRPGDGRKTPTQQLCKGGTRTRGVAQWPRLYRPFRALILSGHHSPRALPWANLWLPPSGRETKAPLQNFVRGERKRVAPSQSSPLTRAAGISCRHAPRAVADGTRSVPATWGKSFPAARLTKGGYRGVNSQRPKGVLNAIVTRSSPAHSSDWIVPIFIPLKPPEICLSETNDGMEGQTSQEQRWPCESLSHKPLSPERGSIEEGVERNSFRFSGQIQRNEFRSTKRTRHDALGCRPCGTFETDTEPGTRPLSVEMSGWLGYSEALSRTDGGTPERASESEKPMGLDASGPRGRRSLIDEHRFD